MADAALQELTLRAGGTPPQLELNKVAVGGLAYVLRVYFKKPKTRTVLCWINKRYS